MKYFSKSRIQTLMASRMMRRNRRSDQQTSRRYFSLYREVKGIPIARDAAIKREDIIYRRQCQFEWRKKPIYQYQVEITVSHEESESLRQAVLAWILDMNVVTYNYTVNYRNRQFVISFSFADESVASMCALRWT